MKLTRRSFVFCCLALSSCRGQRIPEVLAQAESDPSDAFLSLKAFVDTLIPEDETPSASQLGVARELFELFETSQLPLDLLIIMSRWMDSEALKLSADSFAVLDEQGRNRIVLQLEKSSGNTIGRLFFEQIRYHTFGLYYAHPESWTNLGIIAPPQPLGYYNYADSPVMKR